jgi:hypothetical protein
MQFNSFNGMKLINKCRIIFEKLLITNPLQIDIWLTYLYFEINNSFFNHAKKILRRIICFIINKNSSVDNLYFFGNLVISNIFLRNHKIPFHLKVNKKINIIGKFNEFYLKNLKILNFLHIETKFGNIEYYISVLENLFKRKKMFFFL